MVEAARRCHELDIPRPSGVQVFDVVPAGCDGVPWKGPEEIPGSAETIWIMRDMRTQVELIKRV